MTLKNFGIPKWSVLGAVGFNQGLIHAVPVPANYNRVLFNDVLANHIMPLLLNNCYVAMDNASIHNDNISMILAAKNITLVKLPPYSYDLNPIELVFGLAKSNSRRTLVFFDTIWCRAQSTHLYQLHQFKYDSFIETHGMSFIKFINDMIHL